MFHSGADVQSGVRAVSKRTTPLYPPGVVLWRRQRLRRQQRRTELRQRSVYTRYRTHGPWTRALDTCSWVHGTCPLQVSAVWTRAVMTGRGQEPWTRGGGHVQWSPQHVSTTAGVRGVDTATRAVESRTRYCRWTRAVDESLKHWPGLRALDTGRVHGQS